MCSQQIASYLRELTRLQFCIFTAHVFYPSTVALAMSYVPRHLGMASGLSYGVAVCAGGMCEPFLGMAGDAYGLVSVLVVLACLAFVGATLAIIVARADSLATSSKK